MAERVRGGPRELTAQELALIDILIERATQSGLGPSQIVQFPGDVVDAVTDAVQDATDAIQDATDAVTDRVQDVTDAVTDRVQDVTDAVTDRVQDVTDAVTDRVQDATDAVTDAVQDVTDAIGGSEIGDEATVAALVGAVKAVITMKSPTLQQLLDIRAAAQRAEKR